MVDGVAVQHQPAQLLQRPQGAGLARAGRPREADDQRRRVHRVEPRRLFQPVAHRQSQSRLVRALGIDGRHLRLVEGPQRVEHALCLGQLVSCRSQPMYDVPREQRRVLVKADDPGPRRQVRRDVRRASPRRARHHRHGSPGRVVPVLHSRCLGLLPVGQLLPHGLIHGHLPQHRLQCLQRQSAGPQQPGWLHRQIDNSALYAYGAGPAVHDPVDLAHHVLHHVPRTGGAGPSGGIPAGRRHRRIRCRDNGPRHRMVRAADAHGIQPAGGPQGHAVPPGQDHGQRPRPEPFRQRIGRVRDIHTAAFQPARVRHVQDQRVVLWPSLSLENTAHRVLVEPVGPQPVYRLRGDTQQAAPAKDRRRLRDGVFVRFRMEYDGLHHPNLVSSALLFRRSGKTSPYSPRSSPTRITLMRSCTIEFLVTTT